MILIINQSINVALKFFLKNESELPKRVYDQLK